VIYLRAGVISGYPGFHALLLLIVSCQGGGVQADERLTITLDISAELAELLFSQSCAA
jgi:hypothetical protein